MIQRNSHIIGLNVSRQILRGNLLEFVETIKLVGSFGGWIITEFVANYFLQNHIDTGRFDCWTLPDTMQCPHDMPKETTSSGGQYGRFDHTLCHSKVHSSSFFTDNLEILST